jgi:carbon-monoxide dehydrogenase medium subunit
VRPPELARPDSVEEACRLLGESEGEAKLIAGGTAVVLMMRQGLIFPTLLVSLQRVEGLSSIEVADGHIVIGGNATLREIAASGLVRRHARSLARACELVGNVRVRNAATLAGNLAEADYASDPPSVLACHRATCTAQGLDGTRSIPVTDLVTGFYSTALSPTEVITEVHVPVAEPDELTAYLKYVSRSSEDRPCVGVAARAVIRDGTVEDLGVVVGAVGPAPASRPDVCGAALGKGLDDATIRTVADDYADSIDPMEDARGSSWYRREMIHVFVTRALDELNSTDG